MPDSIQLGSSFTTSSIAIRCNHRMRSRKREENENRTKIENIQLVYEYILMRIGRRRTTRIESEQKDVVVEGRLTGISRIFLQFGDICSLIPRD